MFLLLQVAAIWLAWHAGVLAAQYFPNRRPTKMVALLLSLPISVAIWALVLTLRFYVSGYLLNDNLLQVRFFGAFDPPFLGAYAFFAYGGAISFGAKR
jgi:hypothetical protein